MATKKIEEIKRGSKYEPFIAKAYNLKIGESFIVRRTKGDPDIYKLRYRLSAVVRNQLNPDLEDYGCRISLRVLDAQNISVDCVDL